MSVCRRAVGIWLVVTGSLAAEVTPRLSIDRNKGDCNGACQAPSMSADGRYVAFASDASDLVTGDRNGVRDVFVRDRHARKTERISIGLGSVEANDVSDEPSISDDGRFVAFTSRATNLVPGDGNGVADIFVFDRVSGSTTRVSVDAAGGEGDGASGSPALSGDGAVVAFVSAATNLVAADTNGSNDIFVRSRSGGAPERVSVASDGGEGDGPSSDPELSQDGRFVVYVSAASTLVGGDHNQLEDVFVHDRATATTERASLGLGGGECDGASLRPVTSADGRFVAYDSGATNCVGNDGNGHRDVFVLDRVSGVRRRASVAATGAEGDGDSRAPALSADGRWVAYDSDATNFVTGDTNGACDTFVRDLDTGMVVRSSVGAAGEVHGASYGAVVTDDGAEIAFLSDAADLVTGDGNGLTDVFARERCVDEAAVACYGDGVPGTNGLPQVLFSDDPELNTTFVLTFTNSWGQDAAALLLFGTAATSIPTNLQGSILVVPLVAEFVLLPASGLDLDCPIEPDPSLCGAHFFVQLIQQDAGGPCGAAFSCGYDVTIGY